MKATQYLPLPLLFQPEKNKAGEESAKTNILERSFSANFWPLMITLVLQYIHIERNMFGSLEYHEFFFGMHVML